MHYVIFLINSCMYLNGNIQNCIRMGVRTTNSCITKRAWCIDSSFCSASKKKKKNNHTFLCPNSDVVVLDPSKSCFWELKLSPMRSFLILTLSVSINILNSLILHSSYKLGFRLSSYIFHCSIDHNFELLLDYNRYFAYTCIHALEQLSMSSIACACRSRDTCIIVNWIHVNMNTPLVYYWWRLHIRAYSRTSELTCIFFGHMAQNKIRYCMKFEMEYVNFCIDLIKHDILIIPIHDIFTLDINIDLI